MPLLDAGTIFCECLRALGVAPRYHTRLWKTLAASHHPEREAFKYSLVRAVDFEDRTQQGAFLHVFVREKFTPALLCALIEEHVPRRQLSRREASRLQDVVLARTDAAGRWK